MQIGFDIVRRSLRDGDVSGAAQAIRNGLMWRSRRLKQAVRRRLRRLGIRRSAPAKGVRPGAPSMSRDASLAAANAILRTIGASDREIRPLVRGPELTVAVIVPTYADTRFLGDTLRSVQRQTYRSWRCYVVDDASPENVDAVMSEFRNDDRFVLLRHGANAGLAAARNTGIRASTEDVLQFLDGDDMLTPWALERRVESLRDHWLDPTVAGVHGQVLQCPEETTLEDVAGWRRKPTTLATCDWLSSEGESPLVVHAPLVRTDVVKRLGGFDERFVNGAEDWDFWRRLLRHGFVLPACPTIVGAYRQRRASMIRAHGGIHLARADELYAEAEKWVKVDDELAASNARMPIGEGRVALNRLLRAAQWAGQRVAQSGDLASSVDEEILAFLTPASTVTTRRSEVQRAARSGIIRGLGLSVHVVDDLEADTRKVVDRVAQRIADELIDRCVAPVGLPNPSVDLRRREHIDVLLLPEHVDDVVAMRTVFDSLVAAGSTVRFVDLASVNGDGGARRELADAGIQTVAYNSVALGTVTAALLVTRAPMSPGTRELLQLARNAGAATCFLDQERPLVVEGLEPELTAEKSLSSEEIVEIASTAWSPGAIGAAEARPRVTFPVLLPYEENHLDAAGHEWLMSMRDSCVGRTAIVIGNGPSLNLIDFSLLTRADTFGVNSIFLASERLPRPLTYYVVEDTAVFKDNAAEIKAYEAENKLFPTLYQERLGEVGPNTHFFRMNMGFYGRPSPHGSTGTVCLPRFSTNAAQRVFCGQSVTIINLQLAHWFGYSRVLLIGMDFSYQIPSDAEIDGNLIVSRSDDPNHFHPDYFGVGKTWKDPKLDRVLASYRLAHRIYRRTGREIINCTVGGELHEFPRATLEDALSVADAG